MISEREPKDCADGKLAAVCGLFCGACTLFIATKEDPARLALLASRLGVSQEEARCHGCRSDKRFLHCASCRMSACAAQRGIDFCGACQDYPCRELKEFQAQRPHRIELLDDLERIHEVGQEQWLREMREHYSCPQCGTVNSAYDLKCRSCGIEPSCEYTARHGEAVVRFLHGAGGGDAKPGGGMEGLDE